MGENVRNRHISTLRIWVELLKHKVGIAGAVGLFLLNIPVVQYIDAAVQNFDYFSYRATYELIGIALFGAFYFPVLRTILRGKVEQGRPRIAMWLFSELAAALAIFIVVYALIIFGILIWPELGMVIPSVWQEVLLEVMIAPFFLGLFVWQAGLVLGRKVPSLKAAHHYVWERREPIVLVYAAVALIDLPVSWWISETLAAADPLAMIIAFSARYAFFTWLLSILVAALYLDCERSFTSVEDVFA